MNKSYNKLIADYASAFCKKHSGSGYSDGCSTCDNSFAIITEFFEEALQSLADELRLRKNNCAGECSQDIETIVESYD